MLSIGMFHKGSFSGFFFAMDLNWISVRVEIEVSELLHEFFVRTSMFDVFAHNNFVTVNYVGRNRCIATRCDRTSRWWCTMSASPNRQIIFRTANTEDVPIETQVSETTLIYWRVCIHKICSERDHRRLIKMDQIERHSQQLMTNKFLMIGWRVVFYFFL